MRNIEAGNSLCENVATDSNRAQRGKLLERKFHHCVSSKSQKPNSKQTANHQISKGLGKGGACPTKVNPQYQFGTSDLRIGWDFGFGTLDLLRIRSSRSSSRASQLVIFSPFWFSLGVHAAASVIGLRCRGARREVREHLVIDTLRTCGPIEFCQRRIVSEERLQPRRLRSEQLHLCVEHVQLNSRACVQARLGKAQRFLGLLDIFFLALDQLTVLQQI